MHRHAENRERDIDHAVRVIEQVERHSANTTRPKSRVQVHGPQGASQRTNRHQAERPAQERERPRTRADDGRRCSCRATGRVPERWVPVHVSQRATHALKRQQRAGPRSLGAKGARAPTALAQSAMTTERRNRARGTRQARRLVADRGRVQTPRVRLAQRPRGRQTREGKRRGRRQKAARRRRRR